MLKKNFFENDASRQQSRKKIKIPPKITNNFITLFLANEMRNANCFQNKNLLKIDNLTGESIDVSILDVP